MSCPVCRSEHAAEVEALLTEGILSVRAIGAQVGICYSYIQRHKACIREARALGAGGALRPNLAPLAIDAAGRPGDFPVEGTSIEQIRWVQIQLAREIGGLASDTPGSDQDAADVIARLSKVMLTSIALRAKLLGGVGGAVEITTPDGEKIVITSIPQTTMDRVRPEDRPLLEQLFARTTKGDPDAERHLSLYAATGHLDPERARQELRRLLGETPPALQPFEGGETAPLDI